MQIFRIFKEKSLGRSLGILVSGCVDIIANGRKASSCKERMRLLRHAKTTTIHMNTHDMYIQEISRVKHILYVTYCVNRLRFG